MRTRLVLAALLGTLAAPALAEEGRVDASYVAWTSAENRVAAALDEAVDGRPVSVGATTPYGCSVKYANE